MLTIANPNHWRGYMIGSWWLTRQGASSQERAAGLREARNFIDEGIANNPTSFQLHIMRARILIAQERNRKRCRISFRPATSP